MSQLSLRSSKREVQIRERLATTLIPNSAFGKVTNQMKPEGREMPGCNASEGIELRNNHRVVGFSFGGRQ